MARALPLTVLDSTQECLAFIYSVANRFLNNSDEARRGKPISQQGGYCPRNEQLKG
jgi:hypothetical protein